MTKIKFELNKTVGKIVKVICQTCKTLTRHKVLASVEENGEEPWNAEESFYWSSYYQIIQCQGCGTVSFRNEQSNSEDYRESGIGINELIYPKRSIDTWQTKQLLNIPYDLRRIYRETIDCLNNENLTLCGAGVRALVEGLCNENGIKDGDVGTTENGIKKRSKDLSGRINGLYEVGKLTKRNSEILHEHRLLGNLALHELSTPTIEELTLAIEIIENIFENLYEIPEKASDLKKLRLKKKK
jgi:hypothetical protein